MHQNLCSLVLLALAFPLADAEEMECVGGPSAVCKCLLGCDVFGGSGTQCRKTGADQLALVDAAVRDAMKDDGADCEGMMCVVHCANKLNCLDAAVESRCLTVRHANPECKVKCNHAWRRCTPSMFVWLATMLIIPLSW
eukprot:g22650.t1